MEFSEFLYGGSHLGNEIKIQGGTMKKYLFGLGAMLVGAGLMFVLMHGEVRADDTTKIKCEVFDAGAGHHTSHFSYCKI